MALFEGYERRVPQILPVLRSLGMDRIEAADELCKSRGVDVHGIVRGVQPICFDNACWAYTLGAAIAITRGQTRASEIAKSLGEGLQAFCIPGSVADDRKVGLGHGNLASMLLRRARPSASRSWPATSRSRRPRGPSASPRARTGPARSRCASS